MISKKSGFAILALLVVVFAAGHARAQGGWRQWEIYLVDGTSVLASPLQLRVDGKFTRSMDPNEVGFSTAQIDYFASIWEKLPPTPTGKYKQDLIVMLDGKRSFGKVTFKSLKFSEGTIVQNGKEISLKSVAYIKFAHPPAKTKKRGKG
jgi:hypothetical protein